MNQANSFRVLLCVLAAAFAFAATPARAQTYPTRPVRVILPFAAGGIADITTRVVAERLGDRLGQRVIVDNQPGAGGIAAARSVLASPADGYTLALVTNGTAISVPLFKTLPFDPVKDFVPISALGNFDLAMTVERGFAVPHARRFPQGGEGQSRQAECGDHQRRQHPEPGRRAAALAVGRQLHPDHLPHRAGSGDRAVAQ